VLFRFISLGESISPIDTVANPDNHASREKLAGGAMGHQREKSRIAIALIVMICSSLLAIPLGAQALKGTILGRTCH